MDKIERLKKATLKVNEIISGRLPQLLYFNNVNINKNLSTFKRELLYGNDLLVNNQLAAYSSKLNSLLIEEEKVNEDISDEQLEILILHEYIHMASTDIENQVVGFESNVMPVTYNEALTQWLTLKLYYGEEDMDKAIQNNILYPESVKMVDGLIKTIGEEEMFNGFFEADIKKNTTELPKEKKDIWLDTVLQLGSSEEERVSKNGLKQLEQKILELGKDKEINNEEVRM